MNQFEELDLVNKHKVLSVELVAVYLGISESKVREAIKKKTIPFIHEFGRYLFYKPKVDEWLYKLSIEPNRNDENSGSESEITEQGIKQALKIWNSKK